MYSYNIIIHLTITNTFLKKYGICVVMSRGYSNLYRRGINDKRKVRLDSYDSLQFLGSQMGKYILYMEVGKEKTKMK